MQGLRVFLMLCTAVAAASAHACDATDSQSPVTVAAHAQPHVQPSEQPGTPCKPAAPQAATTLKVSARPNAPPAPDKEATDARDRSALGAPLFVTALVMLIIALRRGGR